MQESGGCKGFGVCIDRYQAPLVEITMTFQIQPLPKSAFEKYFKMSDTELARHKAMRSITQQSPGTPCRVSLDDAKIGEEVILINYQHQDAPTPYQSSHAIFIRKDAQEFRPAVGEIPDFFNKRLISARHFSDDGLMLDAQAVQGKHLKETIKAFFAARNTGYIHLHFAIPGCFAAKVTRV